MPLVLSPNAETRQLAQRLTDLQRQWRGLVIVRGLARLAVSTLLALGVLGFIDAILPLPALVRALLLVAGLSATAWFLRDRVLRPWRRLGDRLQLALSLEARFPQFNDALASSLQFAHAQNPALPALERATARLAEREAAHCDFEELLDRRGRNRALGALALALLIGLVAATRHPQALAVSLARWFDPFGAHPWPPRTRLELTAPDMVPRGEPFVLQGRLSGEIPERVQFVFGLEGATPIEQSIPLTPADPDADASFTVRLDPNRVPRNFRYRLRANDSETAWRSVRVVVPPQLDLIDGRPSPLLHLTFPRYTDLAPRDLPDGTALVECVVGTQARLRAAADRPIVRASLALADDPPATRLAVGLLGLTAGSDWSGLTQPAIAAALVSPGSLAIDATGRRIEGRLTPWLSGPYLLRFVDADGLEGRRPMEFRVLPDPSPAVTLERPALGLDSLTVLPDASLPLEGRVSDPVFAIRRVWLEYRVGKTAATRSISLYDGATLGQALPALLAAGAGRDMRLRPAQVSIAGRLELRDLKHPEGRSLGEGDRVLLQLAADDFDDVTAGKPPGRSHEVELVIVGPAALQTVLGKAQDDLRKNLGEIRKLQEAARQKTVQAETHQRQAGKLSLEDQGQLLQAEQLQQQIRALVGGDREGLRAAVERLRRTFRDNPLPESSARGRVEAIASELERITREELEPIEPLLAEARTQAESPRSAARNSETLARAQGHQREVEQTLRDLETRLEPWTEARELRGETESLRRDQERLQRDQGQLESAGQIGERRDRLTPEQQGRLERLVERQQGLSDRAGELVRKLQEKLQKLQAAQAARGAEAERKQAEAATAEEAAAQSARPETASARRREAEQKQQQARAARQAADDMQPEIEAVRQALQQAENTSTAGSTALPKQMRDAAESLARNEVGKARDAQEASLAALRGIDQALNEPNARDEDRLAKLKRIEQVDRDLEALLRKQEQLRDRAEQAGAQPLSPGRTEELRRLGAEQKELRARTRELAQRLNRQQGEAAARELRRAQRAMDQAANPLEQGEPGLDRLEEVLDRLDEAQDEVRREHQAAKEELQREERTRVKDQLAGLYQRQQAREQESERIFQAAREAKAWRRTLQASLAGLAQAEKNLAQEILHLKDKEFTGDRLAGLLLKQASEALLSVPAAVEQIREQGWELDRWEEDRTAFRAPQQRAGLRLKQLLDVLEDLEKRDSARVVTPPPQPGQDPAPKPEDQSSQAKPAPPADPLPSPMQLKLLRVLQAEINEQTEKLHADHPDPARWTPEVRERLDAIRQAQSELVELLAELTAPPAGKLERP